MMNITQSDFSEILKRDGRSVSFDFERIVEAIFKAAQAVGGNDRELAKELAHQVIARLRSNGHADRPPMVEEIQNAIEKTLIEAGHAKTAKAFILYRQKRHEDREIRSSFLAIENTIDRYFQNARDKTGPMHFRGLLNYAAGSILSNYALNKLYPPAVSEAHRDGFIFIHGLDTAVAGRALALSARKLSSWDLSPARRIRRLINLCAEWPERIIVDDIEAVFDDSAWAALLEDDLGPELYFGIRSRDALAHWSEILFAAPGRFGAVLDLRDLVHWGVIPAGARLILQRRDDTSGAMLGLVAAAQYDAEKVAAKIATVGIYLDRIAAGCMHMTEFLKVLDFYLQTAKHALVVKKKTFDQNLSAGLFRETSPSAGPDIETYLSVAPSGLMQAASRFENSAGGRDGLWQTAREILDFMKRRMSDFQVETSCIFALDCLTRCDPASGPIQTSWMPPPGFASMDLLPFLELGSADAPFLQELASRTMRFTAWMRGPAFFELK